MALSLVPASSTSTSSSNGLDVASSHCARPLSANRHRPLRLPVTHPTPRLQLRATTCRSATSSTPSPSPSSATLDLQLYPTREPLFNLAAVPAIYSHTPSLLQSPNRLSPPGHLDPVVQSLEQTFRNSPNGELCKRWQEYHGCSNWEGLLSPLDPDLRAEIVKYGDFAQLTYDAFDDHEGSATRGECLHEEQELLQRAGLKWSGYTVTKYIYASSDVHLLPKWLEMHESSWMGFIAVATDEKEIARLGRRDVVVVWRGTVTRLEWLEDMDGAMIEPCGIPGASHTTSKGRVGVERGFHTLYTACNMDAPHGHTSASDQVRGELKRLVAMYKGPLSITMTGHSLGGALALLSAYDVVLNGVPKDVPVSVISFAAPRVGNEAFKSRLEEVGVKVLRVVNINDMVPKVPGVFAHEEENAMHSAHSQSHHQYRYVHAGVELRLDNHFSPFVKPHVSMVDSHNLELYLHLVDGYRSSKVPFIGLSLRNGGGQLEQVRVCLRFMKRDVALVNKTTGLLLDELHVQSKWQEKHFPKPSPRLSPPHQHSTTPNAFNHFVHQLLHPHFINDVSVA